MPPESASDGQFRPVIRSYAKRITLFTTNSILHIVIGATNALFLSYSLSINDNHVIYYSIGLNFFYLEGLFSFSKLNPFKRSHKKLCHITFQLAGSICLILGAQETPMRKPGRYSLHLQSGYMVLLLFPLTAVIGVSNYLFKHKNKRVRKVMKAIHMFLGLVIFLTSTICFMSALLKPSFMQFYGAAVTYAIIFFVAMCSLAVVITVLFRWTKNMYNEEDKPDSKSVTTAMSAENQTSTEPGDVLNSKQVLSQNII